MKDEEKQIEELTNELIYTNSYGTLNAVAEHLYNVGYRKQEWISVEERLPKHLEKVLVCDDKQNMFTALYVAYDNGGFDWCTSVRLVYKVTHWMPLPEAPKGGAE